MRRAFLLVVLTTLLGGCTNQLGRSTPECGPAVRTSMLLQVQALPDAAYVPCVGSLPIGWEYNHLQARSGLTEFTLDSDRMGDDFVRVRTSERCDIGGTREEESPIPGMLLLTDIEADLTVPIVFVPEGPDEVTVAAAQAIVTGLVGEQIDGREIDVTIDRTDDPSAERIRRAHDDGANVFVIGLREAEEGTVTVVLAGASEERTLEVPHAIDLLENTVGPPTYRGSWFHLFEGGCTEYRFDATGPETHTLEERIRQSLGFTDAEAIRQLGRSLGYDI